MNDEVLAGPGVYVWVMDRSVVYVGLAMCGRMSRHSNQLPAERGARGQSQR